MCPSGSNEDRGISEPTHDIHLNGSLRRENNSISPQHGSDSTLITTPQILASENSEIQIRGYSGFSGRRHHRFPILANRFSVYSSSIAATTTSPTRASRLRSTWTNSNYRDSLSDLDHRQKWDLASEVRHPDKSVMKYPKGMVKHLSRSHRLTKQRGIYLL